MILIDRLIASGVRFVLDKVATAVDAEFNDLHCLRDALLDAQMRLELGEITEEAFQELEAVLMGRMREIREREGAQVAVAGLRVTGAEVSVDDSISEG